MTSAAYIQMHSEQVTDQPEQPHRLIRTAYLLFDLYKCHKSLHRFYKQVLSLSDNNQTDIIEAINSTSRYSKTNI